MKKTSIALMAVLVIPLLAWGIGTTKIGARRFAHIVFDGRVVSIAHPESGTNDLGIAFARIYVMYVSKGTIETNEVITVAYEEVCTGSSVQSIIRCPPLVALQIGDIGTFAVMTNFPSKASGKPFILSGDFVEIKTNANHGVVRTR